MAEHRGLSGTKGHCIGRVRVYDDDEVNSL
jgi:hypothetical protein